MPTTNTYTSLIDEAGCDIYLASHIDPESDYFYHLYRITSTHTIHGRMVSGHLQGRLLKTPIQTICPKNILEVGTFNGYSAICMAERLEGDGKLYTFEINGEMEDFTRPWIEGSPVADKTDFRIGDAVEETPKLGILFDMASVDDDKRNYTEVYEKLLPITRSGDYILADNTPWDWHATGPAYDHDQQTIGIRRLNDSITKDDRIEKVTLPLRDGLTLTRKK